MPRVAPEFNAPAQAGAFHARFTEEPARSGSDLFASLLPDAQLPVGQGAIAADQPAQIARPGEIDWLAGSSMPAEAETADAEAAPPAIMPADAIPAEAPSPKPGIMPFAPTPIGAPLPAVTAAGTTAPDAPVPPAIDPSVPENQPTTGPAFPKPGTATTPGATVPAPGENHSLPADAGQQPAAGGKPVTQPPLPHAHADRASSAIPLATAGASAEPADGEAGKGPPPGEAETRTVQRVQKRGHPAPASPAKQARSHAGPPVPAAEPAGPTARGPEIRIATPLDLAMAAAPSAPPSPSGATAAPPPAPPASPTAPVPMAGLAVAIAANAQSGRNHFEIRLDPPELGRIDVRLQVDASGHVTSHLIADRSETLDLLRRDAADLERSLQQAGLKTADNGLQFSLRDRSQGFDAENDGRRPKPRVIVADPEPALDPTARGYLRAGQGAGLDIRV